jgi:hypothetical protein
VATGLELTTDAFTFSAPEGWESPEDAAPQAIAFAIDVDDKDGFADNINVLSEDGVTKFPDLDERGKAAKASLEKSQAKEITIEEPIQLDGEAAATITAQLTLRGIDYRTLQLAVVHDDRGYIITFSFSDDLSADMQRQIAESVAASWAWTS